MYTLFARFSATVLAASVFVASVPVFAGEAEDEEVTARREKEARDKLDAEKKSKKPPAVGSKDNPFGTEKADPNAIDVSKFTGKTPEAQNAPFGNNTGTEVNPLCPSCKGMGILPNLPYKPYTKVDGQASSSPDFAPPWKYCDKCQKSMDVKLISEDMKQRQQQALEHKQFEQFAGKPLAAIETPFVAIHSQLPVATNKLVANTLEKCVGILQANSKSMVLVTTRPDTDDIIMLADQGTYDAYIDKAMVQNDAESRNLSKKSSGVSAYHVHMFRLVSPGAPPESRAVFGFGQMLMRSTTDNKAKPWLVEGFAAYCENATLGTNQNYTFTYEKNEVKFEKNWNEQMRKSVKEGKMKQWLEIFNIDLSHMKPFEYLSCYSIVSCLIKIDPIRFDKFVQLVRDGEDTGPAIEKAYGRKIADLQTLWLQWLQNQK